MKRILAFLFIALLLTSLPDPLSGEFRPPPVDINTVDHSIEAEKESFTLMEGYEIEIFADETNGIANPIAIRWDHRGRLWVLCTWAYPQIEPVDQPDDKLLILEDTDGDGRADSTIVFADGLNMPTGFAIGDGGAYIGEGERLLHLADTNGDDQADTRRVVLSGFGTGDTHQNINSFTWTPDGEMFFCQGMHAFSRIETPWGIVDAYSAGIYRLNPRDLRLRTYLMPILTYGNPWGICFDRWGGMYLKGNSPSVSFISPAIIDTENPLSTFHEYGDIAATRSKSCNYELIENSHMPDDIQAAGIICGYMVRTLSVVKATQVGATYTAPRPEVLVSSSHPCFRPVETKVGPDGALYVADWYNPVIGHYQHSFRHPSRDRFHGRIWRIRAEGRALLERPKLEEMTTPQICQQLESPERWNRYQAKRLLATLPADEAIPAVQEWVDQLDANDPQLEHHLYEAIGVFQSHDHVNRPLLERLLQAEEPLARAYAARVVGTWQDRLEDPLALLERCVTDEHPMVRMEGVAACSYVPLPESIVVALKAIELPVDNATHFSLTQTAHALAPLWVPALEADQIAFHSPEQMLRALNAIQPEDAVAQARRILRKDPYIPEYLTLLAQSGEPSDIRFVFKNSLGNAELMETLVHVSLERGIAPDEIEDAELATQIDDVDVAVRTAAVRLVGLWNRPAHLETIKTLLNDPEQPLSLHKAAVYSLGEISPSDLEEVFGRFVASSQIYDLRFAAIDAMTRCNLELAVNAALSMLATTQDEEEMGALLGVLMQREGGSEALAAAVPNSTLPADSALLMIRWMNGSGYSAPALSNALNTIMGVESAEMIEYSAEYVAELIQEIQTEGNPEAGHAVFTSSLSNCTACHHVDTEGTPPLDFQRGPDLSAVGAAMPIDLIVESIIWPERQLKEGYESIVFLLNNGQMLEGYLVSESATEVILREFTSGEYQTIPLTMIEERIPRGTIMPSGFATSLTRQELRDLVAYLAQLQAIPATESEGE